MENKKIYLAILNITSYVGQCSDAEHVYGNLILSEKESVDVDNVEDWNVKYLGKNIEIFRPLTLELAKELDKKNGERTYQCKFELCDSDPEFLEKYPNINKTNKFDTFNQVVEAGIKKWKELNIDCTFISLYEGNKYTANSYEPSSTVIVNYDEK